MNSLSSTANLARFHSGRSAMYRAIAFMIGAPANERCRDIARGILKECPQPSPIRDELERALASRMALEDSPADDTAGGEAEALSALAEESARAIRSSDLTEAASLTQRQHEMVIEHGGACLLALAAQLKKRGSDYTQHLGEAIRLLVESDRRMLA